MRNGVVLLPGIITPAAIAFAQLLDRFEETDRIVAKELAVYDDDAPPPGYGLDTEVASVLETANRSGFERFHLAGYSFGGAVAAATAAGHPDRLASLGLWEPAWFGNEDMSAAERAVLAEIYEVMERPPEESLPEFVRLNLAPGAEPPPRPPGDPPPWMAKRPAAIGATGAAFDGHDLDMKALGAFDRPVLYVLGGLSNPALYSERAERAQAVFPDFAMERFEERHHFDPPHMAEPDRLATSLRAFWERAETAALKRADPS